MPLGEIKPLPLTVEQVYRLERLGALQYPEHIEQLKHLSHDSFLAWLYMLNPRAALIMAGVSEFREIMEYQRDKRWYQELRDLVWRKLYGTV